MNTVLAIVVYMAIVTWATLLVASLLRTRGWTPRGMQLAFGNRDDLDPPSALAGRAARTAANTLENFALFTALALVAHLLVPDSALALVGAKVFFWCRIAYIPVYLAGVTYLRTLVWLGGVVGLGLIVAAVL